MNLTLSVTRADSLHIGVKYVDVWKVHHTVKLMLSVALADSLYVDVWTCGS